MRNRARTRRAMCAASTGAISPRATAARTADSTCRTSSTVRNDDRSIRDASPGRWKGAAAAIVARQGTATDEACGRSDSTAPLRSAAGPQDRARAAWDWECRAAGRQDCRNIPSRNARAYRARGAKRNQDQLIEIPRFRVRKTGDNRRDRADRQLFPTSAGLRDQRGQHVGSLYVPLKGRPDYPGRIQSERTWRQADPMGSRRAQARDKFGYRRRHPRRRPQSASRRSSDAARGLRIGIRDKLRSNSRPACSRSGSTRRHRACCPRRAAKIGRSLND